jgi:hemerythrin-like domain-containing protein
METATTTISYVEAEALQAAIDNANYWSHQLRHIDFNQSVFLSGVSISLQNLLDRATQD